MEYNGHPSHNWTTWILLMIWLSCPTPNSRRTGKTNIVAEHSARLGLNIHREKSKISTVKSSSTASVSLDVEAIEEIDHCTYLGSVVNTQVGNEADVKARIGKARVAFLLLENIRKSNALSLKNKIRIFNANVKAVLLYGAEISRTTVITTKRI